MGVNRVGNRQLWIADSATLIQNTTNQVLRLMTGGIDCIATDGLTRLSMGINGAITVTTAGNVNVGTSTDYSTATKMNIKGASYG